MKVTDEFRYKSKYRDIARWFVSGFVERAASEIPEGSLVLDAGAGECAYKWAFSHCNYRAVDLAVGSVTWNYKNLDVISMLDNLPIRDGAFDAVVCTQVLEHLEYPRRCVSELYRVLKPGGILYMTVPMSHGEHQVPYDFFRFTSYGVRSVCEGAGFEVEIEALGGIYARWAAELPKILSVFPRSKNKDGSLRLKGLLASPFRRLTSLAVKLFQRLFMYLDGYDTERTYPLAWSVIAKKTS